MLRRFARRPRRWGRAVRLCVAALATRGLFAAVAATAFLGGDLGFPGDLGGRPRPRFAVAASASALAAANFSATVRGGSEAFYGVMCVSR